MVEPIVSFGLQKLWDLLSQEYEQVCGVEDQVTELKRKLGLLSSLMKDADARKHTNSSVRTFVEQIKEIVCDGEDIVETFILEDKIRKRSGIDNNITRLACFIPDRTKYVDISGILTRISNVIQDMMSFGIKITDDGNMQPQRGRIRESPQTFPMDFESDFVGLDASVKELVKYFVEDDNVQVVTITGMGGLGKTTLARQVFNHKDVRKRFNGFSWVCVSQDCKTENVWQKILVDHKSSDEEQKILKMSVATLRAELFQLLETSKSLIVIDDIWKEEDWNQIKQIFPPKKGWKLLLTSRNKNVTGHNTCFNFKPECLKPEESWKLIQNIVLSRNGLSESEDDEEMEKMGKEMVKHCGGLPLAIKVLGGLLAANYSRHDWERLSENIGFYILQGDDRFNDANTNSVDHVLSLSFEELPSDLKHCFLYMAHFPEDHILDIAKLSYYWAAEGVFQRRHYDGCTIRDVGDSYIKELVGRNMIISKRDVTTLRFETCHLHDLMREICLSKAKEENFLQITSEDRPISHSQSPYKPRRVVCQNPTTLHIGRDIENPNLRSLVVTKMDSFRQPWKLTISSFTRLKLLRVLDVFAANFEGRKLPSGIGKLIHLRYLSLQKAKGVYHLPSSLGNLILLIYLNIEVSSSGKDIFVPIVLKHMKDLRYLALPSRPKHLSNKLELSDLVNLEELKNFSTDNCSLNDLHCMAKLRSLSINLSRESSLKILHASISGLRNLKSLEIHCCGEDTLEEEIVWDFVHLKTLMLNTIIRQKLPKAEHFPSQLTILDLWNFTKEDPMPVLEKLPKLKELTLYEYGLRMVWSSGGFPQLQKLSCNIWELEDWTIEEGTMRFLHTLEIVRCKKLKQLPDGLRFITSLKELKVCVDSDIRNEWNERLSEGGEDYYKIQHIPSVEIKEIVCDGEDIVETFILEEKLRKRNGIKNHITKLACYIPDHKKYVDIRGILTRISNVIKNMVSFGIKITNDGNMQPQRGRIRELQQTSPTDFESDFVGLEANVKELVKHFVKDDNVQVVTIMGGLGKTTIARQVFNHEDVRKQFNGFSWVCVSQDCKTKNVWQKILVDYKSREEEQNILKMSVATLKAELFQLLETSKSLIVIDDIWKKEDWNQIKQIFPPKKGWKLLLTSRNENVTGHNTCFNFKPECLRPEESWKLIQNIVLSRNGLSESEDDEEMEKMGQEMVKHCGGLPLAIKVLGGLLAANYSRHDWERLSENIGFYIVRGDDRFNDANTNSIDHVLSLSFEELPSDLKHCFLYMAHFPEDYIIDIANLSYYWAAEGIFQRRHYDGCTIRDVGDSYIKELVGRNMIISKRDVTTLRFETCHLHDMMREICLSKAKEENFLQITSEGRPISHSQSPYKPRRVVCQNPTTLHIGRDIENPNLRSLVVTNRFRQGWKLTVSSFTRLKLLRVLDLFAAKFEGRKLPSGIGKLIHLRYLSLQMAEGVSHLPSSLGNLILVIYLNIEVFSSGKGIFVPNILKQMKDLRYLALPWPSQWSNKLELSDLVNLEELKNFSTKNCSLNDLHGMAKLRSLSIDLFPESSLKILHASISGLRNLKNLDIRCCGEDILEEEIVWDFVHLKTLMLYTTIRQKLPKAEHFPSQLTILNLWNFTKEDPMPVLEKLPKLKKLTLQGYGLRMVSSSGGFPQLQKLSCLLWDLEDWTIEEGTMRFLHTLEIVRGKKLKQLPDGLRFITSLKELYVCIDLDISIRNEWNERLSEGGEDYYKIQHIPSVEFY